MKMGDISTGVWCWCWNYQSDRKIARKIKRFERSRSRPYLDDTKSWRHAEPLTVEELSEFIEDLEETINE